MLRRILARGQRYLATLAKAEERQAELETCLCLGDAVCPSSGTPKVVIVGAGCAGLSAAQRLLSCGVSDVIVLEACDRLGGRVMSCWLGDTLVELGPDSIGPASISNPAYNLAASTQTLHFRPFHPGQSVFLTPEGRAVSSFRAEALLFDHLLSEAALVATENTSLFHYLHLRLQQELLHYPDHLRYDAERVLYGMANSLRNEWGADLSSISAAQIGLRKDIPGQQVHLPQGNTALMASLAECIPFDRLRLRKEVTKVNWVAEPSSEGHRARVCTADGDTFQADYVILTLPIGVLRDRAADIFSPPLPDSKMAAFNSMGLGYCNKIFMEYEEPWWAGHFRIQLGWSPAEITREGNWAVGIAEIRAVSKSVLVLHLNGPEALMIENNSEEEIAMELTRMVRNLLRDCSIPYPHHIIVTRWGSNKFCKGSVMGIHLHTTEDHLLELGQPVPEEGEAVTPVLLFAGDMTEPRHYSQFPGARLSGLREANRILQLTSKFSGPPKPNQPVPPSCPA